MERWNNCVAVVTGASCGIGEACANKLARAGLRVVALARRVDRILENRLKLPEDCQERYFPRKCDITNEDEVKETFKWIEEILGGTDILINNAGCLREGNILEMDSSLIDEVLHTNVKGLIYCSQAAFRSMKERNFNGHLVHINSVCGSQVICSGLGTPSFNIYPPSKFAVTALNEIIRQELNNFGTKIKTTSIHPGLVQTEIFPPEKFKEIGEAILSPDDVADTVMYVISTPPSVLIKDLTVKAVGEVF
ncbi:farnesol dehydrogenase-like [Episyrphus balteatus]|uniref:farnesol dehydrogenase-like n=1 Tax=Episyrphus balteatus TaxID=286459 RepID=UPI002485338A|nr:farnesol dehydrogenase-like [Episyrphus balteatus]